MQKKLCYIAFQPGALSNIVFNEVVHGGEYEPVDDDQLMRRGDGLDMSNFAIAIFPWDFEPEHRLADGHQFERALRAKHMNPKIPVIMVVSRKMTIALADESLANVADFVFEEFEIGELNRIIRKVMSKHNR